MTLQCWRFSQSLVAIGESTKQVLKNDPEFSSIKNGEFRYLLISLGTGANKTEQKYNARECATWGPGGWVLQPGRGSPIVDVLMESNSDMVDIHNTLVFKAFRSENHHLRIEVVLCNFFLFFCFFYFSLENNTCHEMLCNKNFNCI